MKFQLAMKALTLLFAVLFSLSLTGCENSFLFPAAEDTRSDISGIVVNAQSEGETETWWLSGTDSLEGASIKVYAKSSTVGFSSIPEEHTGTVDDSGTYCIHDLDPGRYKICGELEGWTFIPRYLVIEGDDITASDLIAFRSVENAVIILLSWVDESFDVDGLLSYDDTDDGDNSNRNIISIDNPSYSPYLSLDRSVASDSEMPLIESISISSFPHKGLNWKDTAIDADDIPVNQLRYYVTATGTDGSLTGVDDGENSENAAYAQIDVMYNDSHCGVWEVAYNTGETTLHVLTIDALTDDTFSIYSAGNADYGIKSIITGNSFVPVNFIK